MQDKIIYHIRQALDKKIVYDKWNDEKICLKCKVLSIEFNDDYNVNIMMTHWKEKKQNKDYRVRVVILTFTFAKICQIFLSNHTSQITVNKESVCCIGLLFD